jgi:hypothetical protein
MKFQIVLHFKDREEFSYILNVDQKFKNIEDYITDYIKEIFEMNVLFDWAYDLESDCESFYFGLNLEGLQMVEMCIMNKKEE